jgi:phosphoribosylamine--glycine ligase/phosphoribosylformylglycinamidine cyclo-ligase
MPQERLRVLVVGNGGREHALAWKLSQSPKVDIVYVAPGNGGTAAGASKKVENANVKGNDYPGLVAFAQKNQVNLVVPGPEAPLVDGIQGYFQAGLFCYPFLEVVYKLITEVKLVLGALVRRKQPRAWRAPRPSRKIL